MLNKGPYIRNTLQSVLDQTFQNFEIIIVDGGSKDNGPYIVRSFHDKRIIIFKQNGTGVSTARNQGVAIAKANLIAFLDADDEWMPLHLETILKLTKKYPHAGAYSTAYKIKEANGSTRWAKYREIPTSPWEGLIPNYFKSGALGEYPIWTSVVCIWKEIFSEVGGFPEGAWFGEDADLFGKIALKYPIAFSWYMGGIYHREAANRACDRQPPSEEEPFVKTARKAIKDNLVPPNQIEYLNEYIAKKEILRAYNHLCTGDKKTAYKILKLQKTKYFRYKKINLLILAIIPNLLYQKISKLETKLIKLKP